MKLSISSILLALSLTSTVFAAGYAYVADIRTSQPEDGILSLPLDGKLEIHTPFDATVRRPEGFDLDRNPLKHRESGIGLSLDLWEFACEGETVSFRLDWQERQPTGWHAFPLEYLWETLDRNDPDVVICDEASSPFKMDKNGQEPSATVFYRLPVFRERRIQSPSDAGAFTGKLGEWIELAESGGEAEVPGIPALRIRKADSRPARRGGVWINSKPGQEMPKEPKAEIIEYGIYGNLQETGISEDGTRSHMIIDQKHLTTTDRIPRIDGTAFGYRFLPEGYFEENRITFVTRCPDILGVDGTRELRFDLTIQETIVNPIIGWLVEPEDSPGTYVFQIWADGRLLCEKSFLLE